MPSRLHPPKDDTYRSIDLASAEAIINATLQTGDRSRERPDPQSLVLAVEALLEELRSRRVLDGMPNLAVYEEAFKGLLKSAEQLRAAVLRVTADVDLAYFFLAALPDEPLRGHQEKWSQVIEAANGAQSLAHWARTATDEAVSAGTTGSTRWYEAPEGRATNWLYGTAIPELFEAVFKRRYSVPHQNESTSPGTRFAEALLPAMGLALTSKANLRKRLTIARHLALGKTADGARE